MDLSFLLDVGENVLRATKGYAAEVVVVQETLGLTRFAHTKIHQVVDRTGFYLGLRLRHGNRSAVVWWTSSTRDAILHHVRQAAHALEHVPPDPYLPHLVPPREEIRTDGWVEATAQADPPTRASLTQRIFEASQGADVFGAIQTKTFGVALLNSENLRLAWKTTDSALRVNAHLDRGTGWAQITHPDLNVLDPQGVTHRAVEKARMSQNPKDVDPGDWTVILEPLAVADLFRFAGWIGFSGRAVEEHASCFLDYFGKALWHPSLTLLDRPKDGVYPMPFDMEGIPKTNRFLVQKGVIQEPVTDLRTATSLNRVSTGHAMTFFGDSPYPGHIEILPGPRPRDALVRDVEKGLWITRFHYVNVTNPREGRLTGMTRDGTFLVENGEIVTGVKNLRFHISLVDVFREVVGISKEVEAVGSIETYGVEPPHGGRYPTLVLPRFHFVSGTDF